MIVGEARQSCSRSLHRFEVLHIASCLDVSDLSLAMYQSLSKTSDDMFVMNIKFEKFRFCHEG